MAHIQPHHHIHHIHFLWKRMINALKMLPCLFVVFVKSLSMSPRIATRWCTSTFSSLPCILVLHHEIRQPQFHRSCRFSSPYSSILLLDVFAFVFVSYFSLCLASCFFVVARGAYYDHVAFDKSMFGYSWKLELSLLRSIMISLTTLLATLYVAPHQ